METPPPPRPPVDLTTQLHHHLVYTLTTLLPPPPDDSPEALRARNHAAIAKVAALLPVGANELDLAAQCIAARAQAEDLLRLLRQHSGDIALVMRLNAQYALMVRTSLSVQGSLVRLQAARQKREAIEGAESQDAWTQHIVEQMMVRMADPEAEPHQPAGPAPNTADPDQRAAKNVTENDAVSQYTAFETRMREQPPSETALHAALHQAMAGSRSPNHLTMSN